MTGIGRKTRRKAAHGAKADKPKRYEPPHRLQESEADRPTFAAAVADASLHRLRPLRCARMLSNALRQADCVRADVSERRSRNE